MGFTQLAAPGIDNIAGSSMRILADGVVGGTASVLAGGQFNDGFKNGVPMARLILLTRIRVTMLPGLILDAHAEDTGITTASRSQLD